MNLLLKTLALTALLSNAIEAQTGIGPAPPTCQVAPFDCPEGTFCTEWTDGCNECVCEGDTATCSRLGCPCYQDGSCVPKCWDNEQCVPKARGEELVVPAETQAPTMSGYEHNAATCDTLDDEKTLDSFWISETEALYPVDANTSFANIPLDCVPPREDAELVGAWYAFEIPAQQGVEAVTRQGLPQHILNTTFSTDAVTNDPDRHHYLAVLKGDDCDELTCVAYTYAAYIGDTSNLDAKMNFSLTTDTHYYMFVAYVDNGNMDAPRMEFIPTCEDTSPTQELALNETNSTIFCQEDEPPRPGDAGFPVRIDPVAVAMELGNTGDETTDFNVSSTEPKLFQASLEGEVGILKCKVEPDDDDGDADLFVGVDMMPTMTDFSCSSANPDTSDEDCSIFISGASVVNVLLEGNALEIEVSCYMEKGDKISVGVDMTTNKFDIEAGAYRMYYIEAPSNTKSLFCSGVQGLGIHMKDNARPIPTGGNDCDTTGTSDCGVVTEGGEDVYVLVEGIESVSGAEISCQVIMDTDKMQNDLRENDAREIRLGNERETEMVKGEIKLFKADVSKAAIKVSCRVWTNLATLGYGMTVTEPGRGIELPRASGGNCGISRPGEECEHAFSGGNPENAEVFVAVTTDAPARVKVECNEEKLNVQGGTTYLSWGDEGSDKTLSAGNTNRFYLIVPIRAEEIACFTRADRGDLDLYMNLDSPPSKDGFSSTGNDCEGLSLDASEDCSFETSPRDYNRVLYVTIHAWGDDRVEDAVITCNAYGPGISYRMGNPDLGP